MGPARTPGLVGSLEGGVPRSLEQLAQAHIESFDYFLGRGLVEVIERLAGVEVDHPVTGERCRFWIESVNIGPPVKDDGPSLADVRVFPRECREAKLTYKGPISATIAYQIEGSPVVQQVTRRLGAIPLMVKSRLCYLRHLSRAELVQKKEEAHEFGGYFICNGNERIIRLLVQNRRHYVMAMRRSAYRKRGPSFTDMATLIRCVRPDEHSLTNRCHYLSDGTAVFAITLRRAEYFLPAGILLKCFLDVSDLELYDRIVADAGTDAGHRSFVAARAELVLKQAARFGLTTRTKCLEYLGDLFRVALNVPERWTKLQVGEYLLREHLFIHLSDPGDKFNLAVQMLDKLYSLADSQCCDDNADANSHHELLLPGHLLLKFMREQLETSMEVLVQQVKRDLERSPEMVNFSDQQYIRRCTERIPEVGQRFEYLLNTGNMISKGYMDLSQVSGFTIVAEKLNYHRYVSHFRSVHRGAFFTEMRTTAVRKLLPESWGFMCPVHTPDGSPCGLLNHLTAMCRVICEEPEEADEIENGFRMVLAGLGMRPISASSGDEDPASSLVVQLDGKVLGRMPLKIANAAVSQLRAIKAAKLAEEEALTPDGRTIKLCGEEHSIPAHTEIAYIPFEKGGPFPGIFLFTQAARMVRPVVQNASRAAELIGSLEQTTMNIRCPDGGSGGSANLKFSHSEFHTAAMLSVIASLTPYSDFNQSPRNMYQCQMAKQTMGTPMQSIAHRPDNKIYRIQTPQTPITRTKRYDAYHMDEYPSGTNTIVAVLAYTGYDMEDAMILNKSCVERGFAHASVYKTETINLNQDKANNSGLRFGVPKDSKARGPVPHPIGAFGDKFPQVVPSPADSEAVAAKRVVASGEHEDAQILDTDGLPHVGGVVWPGQHYYSCVDDLSGKVKFGKLKGEETALVDQVAVVGGRDKEITKVNIRMRYNRNPVIGDKFSSRHGQKGVLSRLYDDVDMPYAEATGIRPDLIINPHAFPSRMTIGMLIESLTGKAGAVTGQFVDSTPFQSSEGGPKVPHEALGSALEAAGFTRNGGETLISGITGEPFDVDIYMGVVYYQRLRHMVSDKFQVRSTGPINPLTKQPIKGRKFGGGIRFGEMERDSLLAHGAAYLLHDRLHSCSDYSVSDVCRHCGLMISTMSLPLAGGAAGAVRAMDGAAAQRNPFCRVCGTGKYVERVAVPYVFRYLVTELASMNIRCSLDVS